MVYFCHCQVGSGYPKPRWPWPTAAIGKSQRRVLTKSCILPHLSRENCDVQGPSQERTSEAVACCRVFGRGKASSRAATRLSQERHRDGRSRQEVLGAHRAVAELI